MTIDEGNFIKQLQLRNESALMYVTDTYGGLIQSVIRKHLYTLPDYQEECLNDVLLSVWNHIDAFNPKKNSFKNWVAAIARYQSIDYLRKFKENVVQVPLEEAANIPKDDVAVNDINQVWHDEVELFLNCLKPEDRNLFQRLYLDGDSMDEISLSTGLSKQVIYNRISRGRKRIRRYSSDLSEL